MLEIEIRDRSNNKLESTALPEDVFGLESRPDILHDVVKNYLANQRQGTHATKTRGMVRGGGKKPWKQKHTGRARHGSIRSPLWKGGGTVFGPQPRDYSYKVNKKLRRLAVRLALSEKSSSGNIFILDAFQITKPKTKDVVEILKNIGLVDKKVLIVVPEKDNSLVLSSRNIVGVKVVRVQDINTYDIINHEFLLLTKDALNTVKGLNDEGRIHNN
ncbi:50S ribosomal protein L4 [Candidatus Magnetomonas plexicatena]|uniref:50S ribosomal protein L4 n=1 Tax=Candidatus Magnetomonas plexicatena TaxID=2552947 RepID=UPI001C76D393|nr:50S ribosomal protein L4 [Nitrospirales bacterium LBB_01]